MDFCFAIVYADHVESITLGSAILFNFFWNRFQNQFSGHIRTL